MFYYSVANIGINLKKGKCQWKIQWDTSQISAGHVALRLLNAAKMKKTNLFFDTCPAGF